MLHQFGLDARVEALFQNYSTSADGTAGQFTELGRVVRVDRGRCRVATASQEIGATSRVDLTVGDWVVVADAMVVIERLDRASTLQRVDPRSDSHVVDTAQVLCANVDVAFVVEPLDRRVRSSHADRVLALVWESGATPVVVLTKADTHPEPEAAVDALADQLLGVEVVATSATTGLGIDALRACLRPDRTGVLLGASGAGKSSLTNALLGESRLAIGDVRDLDQRGRHTTTSREMVLIPGGGVLIDTPGLRSLGLWDAAKGVAAGFADIEELALHCRFSNCAHQAEPGCAVRAEIDAERLDADRLMRWRKLAREVARADGRQDGAARAQERATQRQFAKMVRSDPHRRRKP